MKLDTFLNEGFFIFPLIPAARIGKRGANYYTGKEPAIKKWNMQASNDPVKIAEWEKTFAPCNWGIRTGRINDTRRLVIFDIDVKNNAGGLESFKLIIKKYGKPPDTYMVKTASGGFHLFFYTDYPFQEVRKHFKEYPGVDILGENKYYIVAPGSKIQYEGKTKLDEYKPIQGEITEIALLETWLGKNIKILEKTDDKKEKKITREKEIKEGERNDALVSLAASLWRGGKLTEAEIKQTLVIYNQRLVPPETEKRIDQIMQWVVEQDKNETENKSGVHPTDTGNATLFRQYLEQNFLYVYEMKRWYLFSSGIWKFDCNNMIGKKMLRFVQDMYKRAACISDEEDRKHAIKNVLRMESNTSQKSVFEILSRKLALSISNFDKIPDEINLKNGVLHLESGKFREHEKTDFFMRQANIFYTPETDCLQFRKFLSDIFLENTELIQYIQKILGRCLSADTSEQEVYIFYGDGENGKSTLTGTIRDILGDYAREVPPSKFLEDRSGDNTREYYTAELKACRAVFSSEPKKRCRLDMDMIKRATGGEEMSARQPYGMPFKFMPEFKVYISTNNKPKITDDSHGAWRRIRLIPFDYRVPEKTKDKYLKNKFMDEAAGIFNWMYEGFLMWKKEGLIIPESVRSATQEYKNEEDLTYNFLRDCCTLVKGGQVSTIDLYEAFQAWAHNNGERSAKYIPQIKFSKDVKRHARCEMRASNGRRYFLGIGLIDETQTEPDAKILSIFN
jgi:putative DNA primase/helicase